MIAFWIVGQLLQAGSTMVSSQAEPSAPVCGRYWLLPELGSNNSDRDATTNRLFVVISFVVPCWTGETKTITAMRPARPNHDHDATTHSLFVVISFVGLYAEYVI